MRDESLSLHLEYGRAGTSTPFVGKYEAGIRSSRYTAFTHPMASITAKHTLPDWNIFKGRPFVVQPRTVMPAKILELPPGKFANDVIPVVAVCPPLAITEFTFLSGPLAGGLLRPFQNRPSVDGLLRSVPARGSCSIA